MCEIHNHCHIIFTYVYHIYRFPAVPHIGRVYKQNVPHFHLTRAASHRNFLQQHQFRFLLYL